jgi:hypothetical protein
LATFRLGSREMTPAPSYKDSTDTSFHSCQDNILEVKKGLPYPVYYSCRLYSRQKFNLIFQRLTTQYINL